MTIENCQIPCATGIKVSTKMTACPGRFCRQCVWRKTFLFLYSNLLDISCTKSHEGRSRTNCFAGWIQQDANAGILLLNVAQLQAFGQPIYFLEQKIPNTSESHIKNRFKTKGTYIHVILLLHHWNTINASTVNCKQS